VLYLENFIGNTKVFDYGDVGDKFYIILKGSVRVEIPLMVDVPKDVLEERKEKFKRLEDAIQYATNGSKLLMERQQKLQKLLIKW